jgi:hypothetical protein
MASPAALGTPAMIFFTRTTANSVRGGVAGDVVDARLERQPRTTRERSSAEHEQRTVVP